VPEALITAELCLDAVKKEIGNIIYVPEKYQTKEIIDLVIDGINEDPDSFQENNNIYDNQDAGIF